MSMIPVELPGLYLDDVESPTPESGIFVVNTDPEEGSIDAPVDGEIQLDVISTVAAIVDKANTDVYVNGVLAVDGGVLQSGYDGPSAIVEMLAVPPGTQLLADGDMEYKGSQLLTDGDMEAGPGPELMTDGDMEAVGTSAWLELNNPILTKESGSPGGGGSQVLRVAYDGTANPQAYQYSVVAGYTVRVTGWARGDGSVAPRLLHGSAKWTGTSSTSWQAIDVTFRTTTTSVSLELNGSSGWVEFDDISVKRTCPYWESSNSSLLTKETGTPHGGSQCIRITYDGGSYPVARQSAVVSGHTYRVSGWARGDGTNAPYISWGTGNFWVGTSSTSWQAFDVTSVASSGSLYMIGAITVGGYVEFDDVTITEDCPDWTDVNGALMSKEGSAHGGSYCLRVTGSGTADPAASQAVVVAVHGYRLTGWARGDGSNAPLVTEDGNVVWTGTTSTSWQEIDLVFPVTSTTVEFGLAASSGYVEFDDLHLVEYHDLRVIIDPTTDWSSEQTITVRVVSETVGGSYTVDYSYTFVTEDISVPELLSASAVGPFTIRATFSESMLAVSAAGENDALNPDNYSFEYQPEDERIAAIAICAEAVAQVSGSVYDVTVDMTPTFWKTYRLTCGDIADDSSNENVLGANLRTADFTSWHPPYWPARRSFDLWMQLSDDDRKSDEEIGDLRRFTSALQDVVDMMLWDIDAEQFYHDIDKAPEWAVDAMLADLGNPFTIEMDLAKKRKLLSVLVEIYQEKGTDEGIVDVARFFLGIEITSVTEINVDTWVLGESELGVDTDLGPSGDAEPYTFWLNVDRTLTDQERLDLSAIVDYMKPAHTHYLIIEPTDPEFVDHWELGLSELGANTYLH